MLWLDLEGTIVDSLWDCNFLEKNIPHIEKFIEIYKADTVGIFTWGWMFHKEADDSFIAEICKRLKVKCSRVITKGDCMDWALANKLWFWENAPANQVYSYEAEESFNEKFDKEKIFIEMFKNEDKSVLIDDTIKDSKRIYFMEKNTTLDLIGI